MSLRLMLFSFGLCVTDIDQAAAAAHILRPYGEAGVTTCQIPIQPVADVALQISAGSVCRDRVVPAGYRRAVRRETDALPVAFGTRNIGADVKARRG